MPLPLSAPRARPAGRLTALLDRHGHSFQFQLHTRPLPLGPRTAIQYFGMDLPPSPAPAAADNFRNCVGHWWASRQALRLNRAFDQQVRLLAALAYAPVCCHARQRPTAVRDRGSPAMNGPPLLREALRHWIGRGVVRWRRRGQEGLEHYLNEVAGWLDAYPTTGGHRWTRAFVHALADEAGRCFAACRANVWLDLIPWLRERHRLDPLSEHCLRRCHELSEPAPDERGGPPADAEGEGTEARLLEDFAASRQSTCPDCHRAVRFVGRRAFGTDNWLRVEYACRNCRRPVHVTFEGDSFLEWLKPAA